MAAPLYFRYNSNGEWGGEIEHAWEREDGAIETVTIDTVKSRYGRRRRGEAKARAAFGRVRRTSGELSERRQGKGRGQAWELEPRRE